MTLATAGPTLRARVILVFSVLGVFTLAAWIWAFALFWQQPVLLGTALLAYSLGLRHAVDADHIAAIDNVIRKMMQQGRRPVSVGFYFAVGHSTVVLLATAAVAATSTLFADRFDGLKDWGDIAGTVISTSFLLALAAMNAVVLRDVLRRLRAARADGAGVAQQASAEAFDGPLSRLLRPLVALISESWHMAPLGFLFGLGFDTATEVGLLGISAAQAAHGMSIWSILVFPTLFAAGMSLIDTADGLLMLGAYDWAFRDPLRKLYYNAVITAMSILVALVVGGIEALGLIGERLNLAGGIWDVIATLNDNFNTLGFAIVGLFALAWIGSVLATRYLPRAAPGPQ